MAIIGPNGAGKTSLLNVLSQKLMTTSGSFAKGTIKLNRTNIHKGDFSKIGAYV